MTTLRFFDCFSQSWIEKSLPEKIRPPIPSHPRTGITVAADGKMAFSPNVADQIDADCQEHGIPQIERGLKTERIATKRLIGRLVRIKNHSDFWDGTYLEITDDYNGMGSVSSVGGKIHQSGPGMFLDKNFLNSAANDNFGFTSDQYDLVS